LRQAHELISVPKDTPTPYLFGIAALREPIEWIIEACLEQGLLPRQLSLDEVLGPAERILGTE
jgi:4,5-dihydroxyphthalate decarboxylase